MGWLLLLLLVVVAPAGGADCIYLANCDDNLVVLDESDLSLLYSMDDRAGSSPSDYVVPVGLVVNGAFAYTNQADDPDRPGEHLPPGTILEFDVARQIRTGEFATGRGNYDLVYASGKLYTPNSLQGTVTIVDPARRVTTTLEGFGEFPRGIAATPDGSRVFVGDSTSGNVFVIDTATDRVVLSFPVEPGIHAMLATDEQLFVNGNFAGDSLVAFGREGAGYPKLWTASLGLSYGLAIAGQELFSVLRSRYLTSVSLAAPHDTEAYRVGTRSGAKLVDLDGHKGLLYIAGNEGVFRFTPPHGGAQLIYPCTSVRVARQVAVAPCPPGRPTASPTPSPTPTVPCATDHGRCNNGCAPDEYCDLPFGTCGAGGVAGVCQPILRPMCTCVLWWGESPVCGCYRGPVCGCDGQTYDSNCEADCQGVSIAHWGACSISSASPTPSPTCLPTPTMGPGPECVYVTDWQTNTLDIIDAEHRRVLSRIPVGAESPSDVAIVGRRAYTAGQATFGVDPAAAVSVVDLRAQTEAGSIPVVLDPNDQCVVVNGWYEPAPIVLVASPDGSAVYVAPQLDTSVSTIDTRRNAVAFRVSGAGDCGSDLAISSDSLAVYVTSWSPYITVLRHGEIADRIDVGTGQAAIAYWARIQGDRLIVATNDARILTVDPQSGAVDFGGIPNAGFVNTNLALDARTGRLSWGTGSDLVVADLVAGRIVKRIPIYPNVDSLYGFVRRVALSGDGRFAYATGGPSGELSIIDLERLERVDGIRVGDLYGLAVGACPPELVVAATPSPSPTPSPTASPSATPSPVPTPSWSPTATRTPSATPTPSATATPSATPTVSPSHTPSPTRTAAKPRGGGCSLTGTQPAHRSPAAWLGPLLAAIAWRRRRAASAKLR